MPALSVAAGVLLLPPLPHTSTSLGRAYDASCCWAAMQDSHMRLSLAARCHVSKSLPHNQQSPVETCSQLTRLRHLPMRPRAPLGPAHLSNAERRPRQVEISTQPPEEVQEHSIASRRQHQGPLRPECTCKNRWQTDVGRAGELGCRLHIPIWGCW